MMKNVYDFVKTLAIAGFIAFFCIRGFIFEPFRIPSSSMEPTLLVGDFLFISKYSYGNRMPMTDWFFWQKDPVRGDIAVFKNPHSDLPGSFFGFGSPMFIKRIVGLPGDKVAYRDKTLYINGESVAMTKENLHEVRTITNGENELRFETWRYTEVLPNGVDHDVLLNDAVPARNLAEMTVPDDMFVAMGDNRDNSHDSRGWAYPNWGFVPRHNLMGRAEFIWWSWDNFVPRWARLGHGLRAHHVAASEAAE